MSFMLTTIFLLINSAGLLYIILNNLQSETKDSNKSKDLTEKIANEIEKITLKMSADINEKTSEKLRYIYEQITKNNDKNNKNIQDFESNFSTKIQNNFSFVRQEIDAKLKDINLQVKKQSEESIVSLKKFEVDFSDKLQKNFQNSRQELEKKINILTTNVNESIDKNFEKTNSSFNKMLESLAKIDHAQKNIQELSGNVISLEKVLTDKKTRGTFGEVQLKQILHAIFGEGNTKIYDLQYNINHKGVKVIPDAVIFYPKPVGTVCVDSKFPLENYQRMIDYRDSDQELYKKHKKSFVADVRKHIDDISKKYIIDGVTASQAVMFIPSEAIFAEITAFHNTEICNYAHTKKIIITSPTNLVAILNTLQVALRDIELSKNAEKITKEIKKLSEEFGRYSDRWTKLNKKVKELQSAAYDVNTTSDKIAKKFSNIIESNPSSIEQDEQKSIESSFLLPQDK